MRAYLTHKISLEYKRNTPKVKEFDISQAHEVLANHFNKMTIAYYKKFNRDLDAISLSVEAKPCGQFEISYPIISDDHICENAHREAEMWAEQLKGAFNKLKMEYDMPSQYYLSQDTFIRAENSDQKLYIGGQIIAQ
jgi:hypothetical protein